MKIYFDESGQSGCVLQKEDILNFQKQPTFAVGAVVVKEDSVEEKLSEKYRHFKNKYNITDEIKGSDLLTRAHNDELDYVMENILDRYHYFVILYDKRFYISTLLLISLLGFEYQNEMPEHFYYQATFLSQQEDDFFIQYLKYIQNPGIDEFTEYLSFLVSYKFKNEEVENAVVMIAQDILSEQLEDKFYDDFLTFGSYDNPNITNLINLTALSELIYFIKEQTGNSNKDIHFIHDHIKEFEDTFQKELADHGINITFADSKEEILLQIADNLVSIVRHAYDRCIMHYKNRKQWDEENKWDMELISRAVKKVSNSHIKFTVPLNDWAAVLSTVTMYSPRYPKKYRNNLHFNYYYQENLVKELSSITKANLPIDKIVELLGK